MESRVVSRFLVPHLRKVNSVIYSMKTMQSAQFKEGHDDSLRYILPSRL